MAAAAFAVVLVSGLVVVVGGKLALDARLHAVGAQPTTTDPFSFSAALSFGLRYLTPWLVGAAALTGGVLIIHNATDTEPRWYKQRREWLWAAVVYAVLVGSAGLAVALATDLSGSGQVLIGLGSIAVAFGLAYGSWWTAGHAWLAVILFAMTSVAAGAGLWVAQRDTVPRFDVAVVAQGTAVTGSGFYLGESGGYFYVLEAMQPSGSRGTAGTAPKPGTPRCPATEALALPATKRPCYVAEIVRVPRDNARLVSGPTDVRVDPAGFARAQKLASRVRAGAI